MAQAMQMLMNEAMKIERNEVLNAAPYERCSDRRGYANGYKPKTVHTRIGSLELSVPQTRDVEFYPKSLQRGVRSERALKLAVAEMYVQGVSTRKVAEITQELCGLDITSTQVSRAAQLLDEELQQWRNRPLGEIPYLILDARYEKVPHGGSVIDCAVLIAIGITPQGKRSILGVSVSLSEAEVHWREFLQSLQDRGLHGVRYIVSDDHAGLKEARKARLAGVPWQRCQFHLQQNAMKYVPKASMRTCGKKSPRCYGRSSTAPILMPPSNCSGQRSKNTRNPRPSWQLGWRPTSRRHSPYSDSPPLIAND